MWDWKWTGKGLKRRAPEGMELQETLACARKGENPTAASPGKPHSSRALPCTRTWAGAGPPHRHLVSRACSRAKLTMEERSCTYRSEPCCCWRWEREEIYLSTALWRELRSMSRGYRGRFQRLQLPVLAMCFTLSCHGLCVWLWNLNVLLGWLPESLWACCRMSVNQFLALIKWGLWYLLTEL